MPQRNGQNPTRAIRDLGTMGKNFNDGVNKKAQSVGGGICPSCNAEVPPKPGFRLSSLKCSKCGTLMGKK